MHLGQTASHLATLLNRPEPTTKMLSRLLREGGWVKKGPRGRHAPHTDSADLSNFLIAFMCCPDSPAVAMERLPHFAALPLDSETNKSATFADGLSRLLDALTEETWATASAKNWNVNVTVDLSAAMITAEPFGKSNALPEEHYFTALGQANDDEPLINSLPYFGGLEFSSKMRCLTLFRIAKVILAGEPDPIDEIRQSIEQAGR